MYSKMISEWIIPENYFREKYDLSYFIVNTGVSLEDLKVARSLGGSLARSSIKVKGIYCS